MAETKYYLTISFKSEKEKRHFMQMEENWWLKNKEEFPYQKKRNSLRVVRKQLLEEIYKSTERPFDKPILDELNQWSKKNLIQSENTLSAIQTFLNVMVLLHGPEKGQLKEIQKVLQANPDLMKLNFGWLKNVNKKKAEELYGNESKGDK